MDLLLVKMIIHEDDIEDVCLLVVVRVMLMTIMQWEKTQTSVIIRRKLSGLVFTAEKLHS